METIRIGKKIFVSTLLTFFVFIFSSALSIRAQSVAEGGQTGDVQNHQSDTVKDEYELKNFGNVQIKMPKSPTMSDMEQMPAVSDILADIKKRAEEKELLLNPAQEKLTQERIGTTKDGSLFVSDDLVIKYKESVTKKDKDLFRQANNLRLVVGKYKKIAKLKMERVRLDKTFSEDELKIIIDELTKDSRVLYAEPNYIAHMPATGKDDVFDERTYADLAEKIIYTVDQDIKVVTINFGGYGYSQALSDAVAYAYEHDAVVVASEKDEALDKPLYPGAYSIIADNLKKRESVDFYKTMKAYFFKNAKAKR